MARRRILVSTTPASSKRNRHNGRRVRPVSVASMPKATPVPPMPRRSAVITAPTARHAIRTAVKPQPRYRQTFAIILATLTSVVVAVVLCLGFVTDAAYTDRVLPKTTLADRDISGMTSAQVGALLGQIQNNISVALTVDGTTKTASGTDLGIWVDGPMILNQVAHLDHRPFWVYFNTPTDIPLTVAIDKDQFNSWLTRNFPTTFTPAADAGLAFDVAANRFLVTSSVPGIGVSDADLEQISSSLSTQAGQGSFSPQDSQAIPPAISDEQAASAQEWANQRLAAQCSFSSDGQVLYTLSQADIASLITLAPSLDAPTARVDPIKVHDFIVGSLAEAIDIAPTTQKLITDEQGNALGVTQEGVLGRTLADPDSLSDQIISCVESGKSAQIAVSLTDVPYTTESSAPPQTPPPAGSEAAHWADVNLATQTVTLMNGYTPEATFILSSGAPNHPTPTGVFPVYAKVRVQSLSGCVDNDCYYYPNVHWATWFYRDYGFHEAYWHDEFGTPVSHGCLNLTYADAQAVFDWLSISDAVYVH